MKKSIFVVAALAALVASSVAVAHLKSGERQPPSAPRSPRRRPCTCPPAR